jgi:hypothetical protein
MAVTVDYSTNIVVATDDAGGSGHAQLVKLAISTAGNVTPIPGDTGNGLDVDVTRLPALAAGTNNIGDVDVLTLPALPAGTNNIGDVDVLTVPALFTDGTQVAIARGAAKGATAAASITATSIDADHTAIDVNILAGGGTGGTASSFGAAFPATGTAIGGSDGTNMLGVRVKTTAAAGNDPGFVVRPVGFITPLGDSMVDDTLNGLGVVNLNNIKASEGDDIAVIGLQARDAAISGNNPVLGGARGSAAAPSAVSADGDVVDLWADLVGRLHVIAEGQVAHDAADAGNPTSLGATASTALAGLTLVADGDRTKLMAGVDGVLLTRPGYNLESIVTGNASNTDGSSTELIAAGAAGVKHYLSWVTLTNEHASTFAYVELKDGTTVKATLPVPPAGGVVFKFEPPIPGTAATAWNFDPSAAVTTIRCSGGAFKSKV